MDYLYKIEITLDDEKIVREGKYDLENVYATIRNWFAEEHISEVKTNKRMLVFATRKDEKYAYVWNGILAITHSYIMPYCKTFLWYYNKQGREHIEDIILENKKYKAKYGDDNG